MGHRVIQLAGKPRPLADQIWSNGDVATYPEQLAGEHGVPQGLRPRVVALALGDAYQRAVLGMVEEGDGEAFELFDNPRDTSLKIIIEPNR